MAENLHVSGVLAVVAGGMLIGNLGPRSMSPSTRIAVGNFWEFTAFVANSLVFLLIGLVVNPFTLLSQWQAIGLAILAVIVVRGLVIFGFSQFIKSIPSNWQYVLHWGGLRGAISLALVLGIGGNEELRAMAFGVVLFTLLVQGTTMGPLINRLGLSVRTPGQDAYELSQAWAVATRASLDRLQSMKKQGSVSDTTCEIIRPILEEEEMALTAFLRELLAKDPAVAQEEMDSAWREVLRTQRSSLNHLFADGQISEEYYDKLVANIDAALLNDQLEWQNLGDFRAGLALAEETIL